MGKCDITSAQNICIVTTFLVLVSNAFAQSSVGRRLLDGETNEDDMAGLQIIMRSFPQLQNLSSNPCIFTNSANKWLSCNKNTPPRVTSLDISSYGLQGTIPDFSQMKALESIKMDHNQLSGKIPAFFGNLPNLKLLNLSYNNLDTRVLPSSLNSTAAIYDVTGNQSENYSSYSDSGSEDSKRDPLQALWSLLGLVIVGLGIWWYCTSCCRRRETVIIEQSDPVPAIQVTQVTSTNVGQPAQQNLYMPPPQQQPYTSSPQQPYMPPPQQPYTPSPQQPYMPPPQQPYTSSPQQPYMPPGTVMGHAVG